jgi:tetratricopeptide (TPR) repeat protein
MRISIISSLAVAAALAVCVPVSTTQPAFAAAKTSAAADEAEIAAMDLEAAGKLEDAVAKHREAIKLAPNNKAFKENAARTLNNAAIAKHEAKDDVTAISYLEEALALTPNFADAKNNLAALKTGKLNQEGIALLKAGDYAGASAKFSEILTLTPDNKAAKINLDVAQAQLLFKDNPAGSVEKLKDAVALDPSRQFLKDKLAEAQTAADAKAAEEAKAAKK